MSVIFQNGAFLRDVPSDEEYWARLPRRENPYDGPLEGSYQEIVEWVRRNLDKFLDFLEEPSTVNVDDLL